ncbi:MAG: hypothetical protein M3Y85_12955, partial [Bacteroidota bacterium]|nr:hypothetical protein [Bacteroidota bacterium]
AAIIMKVESARFVCALAKLKRQMPMKAKVLLRVKQLLAGIVKDYLLLCKNNTGPIKNDEWIAAAGYQSKIKELQCFRTDQ